VKRVGFLSRFESQSTALLGSAMTTTDERTPKRSEELSQEFKKGDRVTWRSHGSNAEGEVLRKITEGTELAGRKVRASKGDPQYLVRSDKSGGEAVHKPSALRKKG
jgi:hypothetical protein